jgi:N-acetylmuramoyl-L-alanine amidase
MLKPTLNLIFKNFLLLAFVALPLVAHATTPLQITIDPGHGGSDAGAVRGRAREADIALHVAEILQQLVNQDENFHASLTRTTNENLSLNERVAIADKNKADLFLSIHANAANDRRARGVEFYFQNHLPPDEETLYLAASENQVAKAQELTSSSEMAPTKKNDVMAIIEDLKRQHRMKSSHKLSRKLLEAWNAETKVDNNAIRQAPFYVVTKTNMPAVLVELGFLTNPKEADRLMDPRYQKEVAGRIYAGLKRYKEIVDKGADTPLQ